MLKIFQKNRSGNENGESPRSESVPIDKIVPGPWQLRTILDPVEDAMLRESVRERGIDQHLLVRPKNGSDGMFELICGNRRLKAAIDAGSKTVPCIIREVSDAEALEIGIRENMAHDPPFPLDQAESFRRATKECGIDSQQVLARVLGVSASRISQVIHLADLDDRVKQMIRDLQNEELARDQSGKCDVYREVYRVGESHLRCLRNLARVEDQMDIVERAFCERLSSERVAELVKARIEGKPALRREPGRFKDLPGMPQDTKFSLSRNMGIIRIQHKGSREVLLKALAEIVELAGRNKELSGFFEPDGADSDGQPSEAKGEDAAD